MRASVNNRFKARTVVTLVAIYGALFLTVLNTGTAPAIGLAVYCLIAIAIGHNLLSADLEKTFGDKQDFQRVNPFSRLGIAIREAANGDEQRVAAVRGDVETNPNSVRPHQE